MYPAPVRALALQNRHQQLQIEDALAKQKVTPESLEICCDLGPHRPKN